MMEISSWVSLALGGGVPLLVCLLWWWNDLRYALPLGFSGARLPPGHMGFPFFGELFTFLWYFKFLRRPDEFINSKRRKYGDDDGVGLYRTHLFGSPSIIACSPSAIKFVTQKDDTFILKWPNVELVGATSLVAVHGRAHARTRNFVVNAVNRPDALDKIARIVQPRIQASLANWAQMGRLNAYSQTKKLTFANIGKLFASLEPGPELDSMELLFKGLLDGVRASPFNFHGTAFHNAIQCRRKLEAMFRMKLEKKKRMMDERSCINNNNNNNDNDLMDGLMEIRDEQGKKLSEEEAVDNIVSLVVAGFVSTSLSIMWAIYYLAKFPNVLHKLREENMAMRKSKEGDQFITREDVTKLKYTNKVVEETIRMANLAPFIFRWVTKEVVYKGYKIPKGWNVILWIRYLHTNPENFEDPLCFNPDRWDEPPKPGCYQVFGGGPRICAGNMLARIQVALFLHHLSVGYKWELVNPDAGMIYLPHPKPVDGLEIKLSPL